MNEIEGRLKGFIDHMSEMIFDLLCFLNIEYIQGETREPINLLLFHLFLIFELL